MCQYSQALKTLRCDQNNNQNHTKVLLAWPLRGWLWVWKMYYAQESNTKVKDPNANCRVLFNYGKIAIDILYELPEMDHILVVSDYFTKWKEAFHLNNHECRNRMTHWRESWRSGSRCSWSVFFIPMITSHGRLAKKIS